MLFKNVSHCTKFHVTCVTLHKRFWDTYQLCTKFLLTHVKIATYQVVSTRFGHVSRLIRAPVYNAFDTGQNSRVFCFTKFVLTLVQTDTCRSAQKFILHVRYCENVHLTRAQNNTWETVQHVLCHVSKFARVVMYKTSFDTVQRSTCKPE